LRSRQLCSNPRTSQHFMEPEGSLPCSQEPSTGPYPEAGRSSPYHLITILILSIQLRLGLTTGLFPSGFLTNFLYAFPFSPFALHARLDHSNYFWRRVMKLLIMQFSPTSCHFISLRSKYSPQHPVLKHPQSMFPP
jgi:hypothetical protein